MLPEFAKTAASIPVTCSASQKNSGSEMNRVNGRVGPTVPCRA